MTPPKTTPDPKADLHFYLQSARDALLWKLDGLSEYDIRRPMTPTGTNLLGLVKHVASVELGYLGITFGRPSGEPLPWLEEGGRGRGGHVGRRRRVTSVHRGAVPPGVGARRRDDDALPLDTIGRVPWWRDGTDEVTLRTP